MFRSLRHDVVDWFDDLICGPDFNRDGSLKIKPIDKVLVDIVRRAMPSIIVNNITGVSPMVGPQPGMMLNIMKARRKIEFNRFRRKNRFVVGITAGIFVAPILIALI